jgi:hypothetical protein
MNPSPCTHCGKRKPSEGACVHSPPRSRQSLSGRFERVEREAREAAVKRVQELRASSAAQRAEASEATDGAASPRHPAAKRRLSLSPSRREAAEGLLSMKKRVKPEGSDAASFEESATGLACEIEGCTYTTDNDEHFQAHVLRHILQRMPGPEELAVLAAASRSRPSIPEGPHPPRLNWDLESDYTKDETYPGDTWNEFKNKKSRGKPAEDTIQKLYAQIDAIIDKCATGNPGDHIKAEKWRWLKEKVRAAVRENNMSYNLSYKVHSKSL